MARVIDDCRWCRFELWMLDGPNYGVHVCRQCDTAPCAVPGSRLRAGPPRASGTKDGWFQAPGGWKS